LVVVRLRLQPLASDPASFVASSTIYKDQTPFGFVPLKTESVAP